MRNGHADEIAKLIQPGRVHRRVYTDPEIFELEMERIYGRAWLFVGHASQVPKPGDYITTELARQPVIMMRHSDGSIKVLFNRCTHRGAKVAPLSAAATRHDSPAAITAGPSIPTARCCTCRFQKVVPRVLTNALLRSRALPRIGDLSRLRFREPCGQRHQFRRPYRPDEIQYRRSGRSRARWRTRARCRAPSLHFRRQLEASGRECAQFLSRAVQPCLDGERKGRAVRAARRRPQRRRRRRDGEEPHRGAVEGRQAAIVTGNGHGWTSNTLLDDAKRSSPAFDEYRRMLAEKVGAERAQKFSRRGCTIR